MKDSFKFIIDIFEKITKDILAAVYQQFGFSILLAILFMFLYLYAKEHGWKSALCKWWDAFKKDAAFRKIFIFVFYVAMILFKTLLNRDMWMNPLSKVMGEWELSAESIENILLFIPFAVLLLWTFHDKLLGETHKLKMMVWETDKDCVSVFIVDRICTTVFAVRNVSVFRFVL